MNILLCVTGFIFCFSSWGMHDANKQKAYDTIVSMVRIIISQPEFSGDANKQKAYDTIVSMVRIIISQPKFSDGIFYNGSDEFKKDFYIEENDQRIIGGTLEDKARNDESFHLKIDKNISLRLS